MVITHQQGGVFGAWIRVRTVGRAQLCLKAFPCSVFGAWIRLATKGSRAQLWLRAVPGSVFGAWIRPARAVGRAQLQLRAVLGSVFGAWIRRAMKVLLVVVYQFMARAVTIARWVADVVKEGGAGFRHTLRRWRMRRKRWSTSR